MRMGNGAGAIRQEVWRFTPRTFQEAMEACEQVQRGPLKLKGVAELGVTKQKKKKKDKDKARLLEAMGTSKKNEEEERRGLDKRTPAQAAFEKRQEKRQMERVLKKASRTHKQRGEDFSRHLDARTEHCDFPKVSWSREQARPGYRWHRGGADGDVAVMFGALVSSGNILAHTSLRLLLRQCFSKLCVLILELD